MVGLIDKVLQNTKIYGLNELREYWPWAYICTPDISSLNTCYSDWICPLIPHYLSKYHCATAHDIITEKHKIAYSAPVTRPLHTIEFVPRKDTPYLVLMGELWDIQCEHLWKNVIASKRHSTISASPNVFLTWCMNIMSMTWVFNRVQSMSFRFSDIYYKIRWIYAFVLGIIKSFRRTVIVHGVHPPCDIFNKLLSMALHISNN